MRTIKPQRLGILHRCFEHRGKKLFVPTVMVAFPFEAPEVLLHEVVMWQVMGAALPQGEHATFDEGMVKPQAEVLVYGAAYPPERPAPSCQVRLSLGPTDAPQIDKRIYVFGDRRWQASGPSDPVPFERMPLDFSRAFGGSGFAKNPVGLGAQPVADEAGANVHPLPNLELPEQLIGAKGQQPSPAGLGGIPLHWPQRFEKAGSYDSSWRKKRYPGLADDVDLGMFNLAMPDQWLEGYFAGGERFALENMHPEAPLLEGYLPKVRARCFVSRSDDGSGLVEVPLQADTVHLFAEQKVGVVCFRGVHEVQEDDAADLRVLLASCQSAEQQRDLAYHQRIVLERLDKELGAFRALKDSELMPPRSPEGPTLAIESFSDMSALLKTDNLLQQNQRRSVEKQLEEAREQCRAAGLDPDAYVPKELPVHEAVDLEEADTIWQEQMAEAERFQAEALAEKEAMLSEAREQAARDGFDFDALMEKNRQSEGGPPRFSADAEVANLRAQAELSQNTGTPLPAVFKQLADPELLRKLRKLEAMMVDGYRRFAQHYPAAYPLAAAEAMALRAEVERAHTAGESLAGRDWTGADLSGLDLSGADLHDAFLEGANLTGCILREANLNRAVLTRADLTGAQLQGAQLQGANLGDSTLADTALQGADLSKATLGKARLWRTQLAGAILNEVELLETELKDVDWSEVQASQLMFIKLDVSGSCFRGATMIETMFLECTLQDCNFQKANLSRSIFITCQGEGSDFGEATLEELRITKDSSFAQARFHKANLSQANMRSTDFGNCDFSLAELPAADLSESNLHSANLYRVVAPKVQMIRCDLRQAKLVSANLMEGSVAKANIRGSDFRGANLFRVDFARIHGDEATQFDEALMKYVRFVAHEGGMQA